MYVTIILRLDTMMKTNYASIDTNVCGDFILHYYQDILNGQRLIFDEYFEDYE